MKAYFNYRGSMEPEESPSNISKACFTYITYSLGRPGLA